MAFGVRALVAATLLTTCVIAAGADDPQPTAARSAVVAECIERLIPLQEENAMWPYEGDYRVEGELPDTWVIPVTYRAGGTSLVCMSLLYGAEPGDDKARAAFKRGLAYVIGQLDHDMMKRHREVKYDMRVLAQAYALLLFCHAEKEGRAGIHATAIRQWMPRLVEYLVYEQRDDGGWNYQDRFVHASFVTSSVMQALLWARTREVAVSDDVLKRGADALAKSRYDDGAFAYFGFRVPGGQRPPQDRLPGSTGRNAICETLMLQCGRGSVERVRGSIAAFYEHWDELEAQRKKKTHAGPYLIAPYYFYYGHRYAAQAIELLPEAERAAAHERMFKQLMRTRDPDGTWNDRDYPRARAYGTAMVALALLSKEIGPPPAHNLPPTDDKVMVKTAYVWSPGESVVNITPTPGEGWYGTPSIHPNGKAVVFAGAVRGHGRIWKYTLATGEVQPLTSESFCSKLPSYSPDGESIVFAADLDLDKPRFDMFEVGRTRPHNDGFSAGMTSSCNLYVMDADGSNPRQITAGDCHDSRPSFSPDGKTVVFHGNRRGPGTFDMWTVPTDGSSEPRQVMLEDNPWVGRPRYSLDGKEIFFFTGVNNGIFDPQGRHTLCRVPASGGAWSVLPNDTVGVSSHGPDPEPSGRYLMYHAAVDNLWGVYMLPLSGDDPIELVPPGFANHHIAHATTASNGTMAFDSRSYIETR